MASFTAKLVAASAILVGLAIASTLILTYPIWIPLSEGDRVTKTIYQGLATPSIEVDIDVGSVEVVKSEINDLIVRLEYIEGCATYDVTKNGETLLIKIKYLCKVRDGEGLVVTVEIPNKLDYLDVSVDVGKVLVKGVDVREASLSVDVGMIEIRNSIFKEYIDVSVDTGEVKAKGVSLPVTSKMEVSVDIGEVSINIDSSSADVRLKPSNQYTGSATIDCKQGDGPVVLVEFDVGSVKVSCTG